MSKMMVSEEMKNAPAAPSPLRRLLCWEGFLLAVTLAVFIGNAVASPYFLNIWNLSDATFTFTEKAIVVLPMAMLIIAREIDLSVASTMALSSTVMGLCAAAGVDTPLLVIIGLGVGLLCGLFNGLLVTRFNLSSSDHHRHHEPVSRHHLYPAGRSGAQSLSGELCLVRPGLRVGGALF